MSLILHAARFAVLAGFAAMVSFGCNAPPPSPGLPTSPGVPAEPPPPPPTPPPPVKLPELAGDYTITLAVSQTCGPLFATGFRTRTYASRLEQNGADVEIVLNGLAPMFSLPHARIHGQILAPDRVTLTTYLGNDQWEGIFEQMSPTNLLSILADEMKLTVSPGGLSGTFVGAFLIYDWSGTGWSKIGDSCFSTSHSVTLSR